jgi:hypothetical protein
VALSWDLGQAEVLGPPAVRPATVLVRDADALDAFVARNAAILSGNTCCWQVGSRRLRAMTSFKYRADEVPVTQNH